MLLRSSSTPVLGSRLSSFSDDNSNNHHHHDTNTIFKHSPVRHQSLNKLPYHQTGCLNFTTISCNSSPISPSIAEFSVHSHKGFRRAQSDGNLQRLVDYSSINKSEEHRHNSSKSNKFSGRSRCLMLETIPSFSFYNSRGRYQDDDEEKEEEVCDGGDKEAEAEQLEENLAMESSHFGLGCKMEKMDLSKEVGVMYRIWNVNVEEEREEMYLAGGLGIDGGNDNNGGGGGGSRRGGGGEFNSAGGDHGGDKHGTEEYYKRMVQTNPGNPLFLRNYAQFLYQTKRDLQGAEEYYSRAILADPNDGEILSQYANLVWESHQDQDRASSYFERAVAASPEDSHVHAAYACFLWETEEEDDECNVQTAFDSISPHFHEGALASAGA